MENSLIVIYPLQLIHPHMMIINLETETIFVNTLKAGIDVVALFLSFN